MKLLLLLALLIFSGCGNSNTTVAGNSSETGNCRIVGVAHTSSGEPAADISVVLTPAEYRGIDPVDFDTVVTDSTGAFSFDTVAPGEWSLTSIDSNSSEGFIRQGIGLELGDTITIDKTMGLLGALNLSRLNSSDSLVVAIPGTPWRYTIPAGETSLLIPALPTDESITLLVQSPSGTILHTEQVQVVPEDTVEIVYQKELLVLHGTGEEHYNTLYQSAFTRAGFVSTSVDVDTGNLETYSEYDAIFIVGTPYLNNSALTEFLATTDVAVVSAVSSTYPIMKMTGTEQTVDYGTVSFGTIYISSEHEIITESGFEINSSVQVMNSSFMSYGIPVGDAKNLATIETNGASALFVYEKGDSLMAGTAPGKRAGIFASGASLSTNGEALLAATLKWAAHE